MNLRLLGFGLLLVLLGGISAYESGQQFLAGISTTNNTISSEVYVNGSTVAILPLTLNQTSFLEFEYNSSQRINFYLLNLSAYQSLGSSSNSANTLYSKVAALEGKGAVYIAYNTSIGVYPYQPAYGALFPTPRYSMNSSTLPGGPYYAIFSNNGTYEALVAYTFLIKPASQVTLTNGNIFSFGLISGVLLLFGFALVIYGLITKGKPKQSAKEAEADINKIYSEIDSRGAARHKRKRGKVPRTRPGKKPKRGKRKG
jgi:hypothetical protein